MNACFLRAMLLTALGVVHLLGGMISGSTGAQQVQAPGCGMACCEKNVCECQPVATDAPSQPVPAAPEAPKFETKFVPMLFALLPARAEGGTPSAVLRHQGEGSMLEARKTPVFRLHCAMLM